jgi:hypothetical protein
MPGIPAFNNQYPCVFGAATANSTTQSVQSRVLSTFDCEANRPSWHMLFTLRKHYLSLPFSCHKEAILQRAVFNKLLRGMWS